MAVAVPGMLALKMHPSFFVFALRIKALERRQQAALFILLVRSCGTLIALNTSTRIKFESCLSTTPYSFWPLVASLAIHA